MPVPQLLRPLKDVDIATSLRPEALPDRIAAVRWMSRPAFGFPDTGYRIWRLEYPSGGNIVRTFLGTHWLPATSSWSDFEADLLARAPIAGPYFENVTESDLGFLLPLVRAVDPRVPLAEREALLPEIADFFDHSHEQEPSYNAMVWNLPIRPTLDQILDDPTLAAVAKAYYAWKIMQFLHALAIRYEYALLFGLAVEEDIGGLPDVGYELGAWWDNRWGKTISERIDGTSIIPVEAPGWVNATPVDGSVGHPAFDRFAWTPPSWFLPTMETGEPLETSATYPRPEARHTALTWELPLMDDDRLIHLWHPVTYRVRSFEHGADTAGEPAAPAAPADDQFTDIAPDSLHAPVKGAEVHAVDGAGRPWPPLEGWVHYRVNGVNLLAIESDDFAQTAVDILDDNGPPPPRLRVVSDHAVAFTVGTIEVDVVIEYGPEQDFVAPDADEFRVSATWKATQHLPVTVGAVLSVGLLDAELEVIGASPAGFEGGQLLADGTSYRILDASATMITVTLVRGNPPSPNQAGVLVGVAAAAPAQRVARLDRIRPRVGSIDAVVGTEPLVLDLGLGRRLPDRMPLYLHALRARVDAVRTDQGWAVEQPAPASPAAAALSALQDRGTLEADLVGSPVIAYPPLETTLVLEVPDGFEAGTLVLTATASDAKPYVAGTTVDAVDPALALLPGNEGDGRTAAISVRSATPPGAPTVPAGPPVRWGTSATPYDPVSRYVLSWEAVDDAIRYEVWRALESAIDGGANASDVDLVNAAATQLDRFELRSDQVWTNSHEDHLPGLAPTRAVYAVRAVGAGGVPGEFSEIIGPVRVPDVRPPARADILAVRAAAPTETDDGARRVTVTVTGPELDDGTVGYRVERRIADLGNLWAGIGEIPAGTTTQPRTIDDADVQPGLTHEWRVVPFRVVQDPVDDTGTATRRIDGFRSAPRRGRARGPLLPPSGVTWSVAPTGGVRLSWINADRYERIRVERIAGPAAGPVPLADLDGDSIEFVDETNTGPRADGGGYSYVLTALAGTVAAGVRIEGVSGAP